jgi:hypothetical protein
MEGPGLLGRRKQEHQLHQMQTTYSMTAAHAPWLLLGLELSQKACANKTAGQVLRSIQQH